MEPVGEGCPNGARGNRTDQARESRRAASTALSPSVECTQGACKKHMRIAEIFHSIQGEGALMGVPSVFVRTSGCPLRCHWCFVPETPILLSDWSWRALGDLRVGDEVVAVQGPEGRGRHQQLVRALVT